MVPNKNYTMRAIKRLLSEPDNKSLLLISMDNFTSYRDAYTKLASDKLAQTYSAIITSTLSGNEFIGSIAENEFLLIVEDLKAEKLANFLIFAFDAVIEKFYSASDLNRGYILTQGDSQAGKRTDFVHTTIGIISTTNKKYSSTEDILNDLKNIHRLAKQPNRSNYLMERYKLSAEDSVLSPEYNDKILIIEKDESLKILLSTVLNLQGYETKTITDFKELDSNFVPGIIILDAGDNEERNGLQLCKIIKQSHLYQKTKIIMTSVFHEKETVLNAGADLYIPKPYEMTSIVKWVNNLMKEINF